MTWECRRARNQGSKLPRLLIIALAALQYEAVKEERRQAELQAAAAQAGKTPLSPLFTVRGRGCIRRTVPSAGATGSISCMPLLMCHNTVCAAGPSKETHRRAAHRPSAVASAAGRGTAPTDPSSGSRPAAGSDMEVEVKLRLPDAAAHAKLAAALQPGYKATYQQVRR